jgi:hypothetical protein
MVKSCSEIQKEIEELKRKLQQNRLIDLTFSEMTDKKKCESNNAAVMCSNCDCWKNAREYCS